MQPLQLKKTPYPIKALVFGEGNFLRGFALPMIQQANTKGVFEGTAVLVKPRPGGDLSPFEEQDCTWNVLVRGIRKGQPIELLQPVTCAFSILRAREEWDKLLLLSRLSTLEVAISNTTEAGIRRGVPDPDPACPVTYPGQLCAFLYARWQAFSGDPEKGLSVLPTELVPHNGKLLLACLNDLARAWDLPGEFLGWVQTACDFPDTLVDRIVSGFPQDAPRVWEAIGARDQLLTAAEPFALWVIEDTGRVRQRFPLDQADLPLRFVPDVTPFETLKVSVLNAAHTAMALLGAFTGAVTVGEWMSNPGCARLVHQLWAEAAPHIPLPQEEVEAFCAQVEERFLNPFLRHKLADIRLNSLSKWRSRLLPLLRTNPEAHIPALTLGALLALYPRSRNVRDDARALAFLQQAAAQPADVYVKTALSATDLWGEDLSAWPGLFDKVLAACTSLMGQTLRGE